MKSTMQTLLELMETEINERVRQRFNHALETMKDIASMVATPTEAANYATKLEAVPLNGHNKPPSSKPKHIKLQLAREAKKRGVKETAQMHHVSETNLRRWMRGEALGRRGGNRFAKKAAVVVAPAAKRRILPKAAKLAIAGEARKNGMVHITAKKHNVNPYQVRKWMAGKALAAPGGYVV